MEKLDLRNAKVNLSDVAYRHILKLILSHQLPPGSRLRPEDIAATVGLSPTPIKQALARLAGEGLVELRPGQGPYVSAPTIPEILELYDARLMCEVHAVQEGIDNVDEAFLSDLGELLAQQEAAAAGADGSVDSRRRLAEADKEIHRHIVSLCRNRKVESWYRQLNVHIKSFQLAHYDDYRRLEESIREHRAVYRALKRKDAGSAAEALRQHGTKSKQSFMSRARLSGSG